MNEITNITPDGVHYVDEAGNQQFIDFETCHQNNIMETKQRWGTQWTEDDEAFWQRAKYVGRRHAWSEPPNIVFYTNPPILIEFSTSESYGKALSDLKQAGWRTNDGE